MTAADDLSFARGAVEACSAVEAWARYPTYPGAESVGLPIQ